MRPFTLLLSLHYRVQETGISRKMFGAFLSNEGDFIEGSAAYLGTVDRGDANDLF